MKGKKKLIWSILFCIYLAAVAYLCFSEPDDFPKVPPLLFGMPLDKIVHFIMFFPFPIAAYESFKPKGQKKIIHIAVLFVLYAVGLGFAIGTEHVQGLLGYRSEDINDFYADIIGMSCAALMMAAYILIKKKR